MLRPSDCERWLALWELPSSIRKRQKYTVSLFSIKKAQNLKFMLLFYEIYDPLPIQILVSSSIKHSLVFAIRVLVWWFTVLLFAVSNFLENSWVYYKECWTYPGFLWKTWIDKYKTCRVKWYHKAHLRLNWSSQVFRFSGRLKGRLSRPFTHLYEMDRSRGVYFTQEEQIVIMNSYEEFKNQIRPRGNTVAHNKGGMLAKNCQ